MAKKKTNNERQLKELTRNHLLGPLIATIIILSIAGVFIYGFLNVMIDYTITGKLNAEYENADYMARLYDSGDEGRKLVDISRRNYLIVDETNNVIASKGKNTCTFEGSEVWYNIRGGKTVIYKDSEVDFVHANSDGQVRLDTFRFLGALSNSDSEYNKRIINLINELSEEYEDSEDFDEAVSDRINDGSITHIKMDSVIFLPVWIEHGLNGGNRIIVQAQLMIGVEDIAVVAAFAAGVVIIALIVFIVFVVNICRNAARNKRTLKVFFTDPVTRGHNRMWFLIKGEQYLRKGKTSKNEFAAVNLDFVDYRNYCLCHSIAEGEKMLVEIQRRLENRISKEEMCAHMNASNFALLLKLYSDEEALKERVQGIIRELEGIHTEHAFHFQAGVAKIGIKRNDSGKIVRRKDVNLELYYSNADAARMTLAKRDGSGVALFDEKLVEERRWIDTVHEHQQSALANEEFVVYYQPKYNPVTDELKGAEALIRWVSPEFGFIPPGRFIPIFEDNGFITEIDHYMIRHVAKDQKAWLDAGFKCVPVSVNVSRAHFIESDLAEQIRDLVDDAGCPHEYIEIELTESAFFDDKNALITTINRLKSYGFSVSMDDFGSGYSSLNSLKDMPLDVLKLDAEFFRGENAGERGELVVSEAIKLAKSLNMRTVAEGVEEKSQVEFLAKQGCDMIQGYFYAKPMPGADYEERMKAGVKPKEEITE